jgi:hypothetical protein
MDPDRLKHAFNEDQPRELFTDGEAGIADLADEVVPAGDQFDDLIFAKTDFAQTILNFRRGAKLFDSHRHAGLHAAQWADFAVCGVSRIGVECVAHGAECRINSTLRTSRRLLFAVPELSDAWVPWNSDFGNLYLGWPSAAE